MSFMADEEKRKRLIAQIESTAEEIRRGQKSGFRISQDYAQLFSLRAPGMHSKLSARPKAGIVFIWLLVVMFLVSSTIILILMKRLDVI
ncbi:ECU05_0465 [Encephalitozoon cuniculi GB-M1]|uniref:ECU05_0465 protein n=1 Tax=Encephalitozoon cuniculi (strain GB-M1) TaxID=284813 RepID=I7KG09_ENCCU|nr:uncharacterized protein ECU05_0465 [Encephalitozoon cuniculi GB-M1]UYI27837.1 hypothetical protein J0A71_08g17240 [Encephalitozoon cuniculi]CCI74103.1 ECU05_0465 [Encephalitozoon cuniculi GB-M1]